MNTALQKRLIQLIPRNGRREHQQHVWAQSQTGPLPTTTSLPSVTPNWVALAAEKPSCFTSRMKKTNLKESAKVFLAKSIKAQALVCLIWELYNRQRGWIWGNCGWKVKATTEADSYFLSMFLSFITPHFVILVSRKKTGWSRKDATTFPCCFQIPSHFLLRPMQTHCSGVWRTHKQRGKGYDVGMGASLGLGPGLLIHHLGWHRVCTGDWQMSVSGIRCIHATVSCFLSEFYRQQNRVAHNQVTWIGIWGLHAQTRKWDSWKTRS